MPHSEKKKWAMDKHKIFELLERDLEKETISEVIGKMETLLAYFKENPQYLGLVPFLETYYLVTKKVAEKRIQQENYYNHPGDLEKLDVVFASLYFRPLATYLKTGKANPPWSGYFDYCEKDGIPFLKMLLGINAHINTDLCITLISLGYRHKNDYFVINDILDEVIPEIMHFLAFTSHDIFGISGLFFKKIVEKEFRKTVVQWRQHAWNNALAISTGSYPDYHTKLNKCTEETCVRLIATFHELRRPFSIPKFNLKLEKALVKFE